MCIAAARAAFDVEPYCDEPDEYGDATPTGLTERVTNLGALDDRVEQLTAGLGELHTDARSLRDEGTARQEEIAGEASGPRPIGAKEEEEPAPPGYRWVHSLWRTLPDGTRDYAAYYGKTAFRFLAPLSSKLRAPKR